MQQDGKRYTLADGISATGNELSIRGGEYAYAVIGDSLNGSVYLEILINGAWSTVVQAGVGQVGKAQTIPYFQTGLRLPAGRYRVAISGSASNIKAWLYGLV